MTNRRLVILMCLAWGFAAWALGPGRSDAQPQKAATADAAVQQSLKEHNDRSVQAMQRKVTRAQREAAAAARVKAKAKRAAKMGVSPQAAAMDMPMPTQGGIPDYFSMPNWANSPPLRKFVDTLPGLTSTQVNNLGQYIPIAKPDTITYPGSDYYEIGLREYTEKLHSDLPPTRLRGYVQLNKGTDAAGKNTLAPDPIHYLGPLIIAQKDRPVRIKFTNQLPTGKAGDLFIPVDTTVMGAGMGPKMMDVTPGYPMNYTQNRATLHLHGGHTPWISDGTPHQWITPAGEKTDYPKGVSVSNVPDMPDPGPGSQTFFYTNQQSARLMFYHDHALAITRLNVYVGEAAGYLITDQAEKDLITSGTIPAEQIPLIIQDKSFVDATPINGTPKILETDPTWNWGTGTPDAKGIRPPVTGDLWYPHVYMTAQNPYDLSGANPFGRWHYGPWFWPPTTNIEHPPVPNPYYDPINAPWQPPEMPGVPHPSMPGESFFDTALVNGTAYPTLTVEPKSYRFRILNAANDRFWNLQMYVADPSVTTSDGRINTEVKMVPAAPWTGLPENWPTDGREGGVPDPAMAGPNWIQIGTEGGFLPAPAVIPSQPIAWNMDPTTFNFGNVSDHSLLVAPAERADVIVDFSKYAGKTLILYNDAPAAFPALDARYDYYTGAPDLTETGGHPGPQAGFAPNTRTIMQIKVADLAPADPFDLAGLQKAFKSTGSAATGNFVPGVFAKSQDPIIVAQANPAYESAYNKAFPKYWPYWGYMRIQDLVTSFSTITGTRLRVPLQNKGLHDEMGAAYDEYGRMSGKLGVEVPNANPVTQNFILYGYLDPPTEIMEDSMVPMTPVAGDGTQIWKITHNGVDTHPIHFHLFDVQLINRVGWDGAIRLPDDNELGWKDTVRMSPLEDTIVALRPVAPLLPFGVPNSIRLLDPTMPEGSTAGFANLNPLTGQALNPPVTNMLYNFGWEYVWHCHILSHEEMDMMRPMSFKVTSQLPTAPVVSIQQTGTIVDLTWTDATSPINFLNWGNPANEIGFRIERAIVGKNGMLGAYSQLGSALANMTRYNDATPVAGVTYSYRVVAFNTAGDSPSNPILVGPPVPPAAPSSLTASIAGPHQIDLAWSNSQGISPATGLRIERASGAGAFTVLGTVAATATAFSDVAAPDGNTLRYRVIAFNDTGDSASNTATVNLPLTAPSTPAAALAAQPPLAVALTWVNNSLSATGLTVQRATNAAFTTALVTFTVTPGTATSYQDKTSLAVNTTYYYRIRTTLGALTSEWSATVSVTTASPSGTLSLSGMASPLSANPPTVTLAWGNNVINASGFTVQRATNSNFNRGLVSFTVLDGNVTGYIDTTSRANTRFYYRVCAFNTAGASAWSNSLIIDTPGQLPQDPTNLAIVASRTTQTSLRISWTDNAANEQGFYIERSVAGFNGPWIRIATIGANTTVYTNTGLTRNATYWYRVQAYNADGASGYTNVISGTTLP